MPKQKSKCGFKTNTANANLHSISFNDLTSGEVLALIHALQIGATISSVTQDLITYLRNVLYHTINATGKQSKIAKAQEFFTEISTETDLVVISKEELRNLQIWNSVAEGS
jgi:hypothetical protein